MFRNKADTEWGSAKPVPPGNSPTKLAQPVTLADVHGDLAGTMMTTVAIQSLPVTDNAAPQNPFACGPLVGIVEFSGGGGGGVIEFDVPCNSGTNSFFTGTSSAIGVAQGGGAMVSVPGQVIKVSVRNDAALEPRLFLGAPSGDPIPIGDVVHIPNIKAFVGYHAKTGRLTRTIWVLRSQPTGSGPNAFAFVDIPPFARSFSILRRQTVPADTLEIDWLSPGAGGPFMDAQLLAGGVPSPEFAVGCASQLKILVTAANAGTFSSVAVVFNLEN